MKTLISTPGSYPLSFVAAGIRADGPGAGASGASAADRVLAATGQDLPRWPLAGLTLSSSVSRWS